MMRNMPDFIYHLRNEWRDHRVAATPGWRNRRCRARRADSCIGIPAEELPHIWHPQLTFLCIFYIIVAIIIAKVL